MTEFDKFGRRGKPQRELYKPGSGPLRKSGREDITQPGEGLYRNIAIHNSTIPEKTAEINRVTERLKNIPVSSNAVRELEECKSNDISKKNKRPGYEIYVPKPVAEARQKDLQLFDHRPVDSEQDLSEKCEKKSYNDRKKKSSKKKRGKTSSYENDHIDDEKLSFNSQMLKSRESLCNDERDNCTQNRFARYGSEPRSLPFKNPNEAFHDNRLKDNNTMWSNDRSRTKPPLGGRGSFSKGSSKQFPPSFESLPPRLKKKFIAENGMQDPTKIMYIGNTNEGSTWDGSTVTFKGNSGVGVQTRNNESLPVNKPLLEWSNTLPCPGRARGRGRLNRETYLEFYEPVRCSRSLTPETIHDSRFENALYEPGNTVLHDHCSRPISMQYQPSKNKLEMAANTSKNVKTLEDTRNGVDGHTDASDAENVLDWAAEVERCEQEDIVHLSRPTSRESFVEPGPPVSRDKKKKRNRKACKGQKERSISREGNCRSSIRRGSVDNISNYSRNNSIERNWRERSDDNHSRKNSSCDNRSRQSSIDRRENFNNKFSRSRQNSSCDNRSRQSSLDRRDNHFNSGKSRMGREETKKTRGSSRENRNARLIEETNWRLEQELVTRERERTNNTNMKTGGILVLPQPIKDGPSPRNNRINAPPSSFAKRLYDPSNPEKPITVASYRANFVDDGKYVFNASFPEVPMYTNTVMPDQLSAKPIWYNPYTDNFQASHNPQLIRAIQQADCELQYLLSTNELLKYWDKMQLLRSFLKDALKCLLLTDLRFCEIENVEQHFWKILYYNVIELLRKLMMEQPETKESYKQALLAVIEEGSEFYEKLLKDLEHNSNIQLEAFLNTPICVREHLKDTILPMIAAQKLFLSLGDLARYKEQANEGCNYGLARQWYMKAHQVNPKNGRPYNQLAILALYTKRKLEAVYYYMRCLMSSNPISAARESLVALFDESRKKYEAVDRKRKEEKAKKEREKMKEKEGGGGIRREIWIHPAGNRKNMHRTTSTCKADFDSEDEELYVASSIEVNKRFVTSYLNVHGKIFTKIGLETLTETALQMLKQFRALIQHSPIPLNSSRFLQLFALNMFAIEVSQPKGDVVNSEDGCYRSATQESALVISLQMFNLLLERFVNILIEQMNESDNFPLILPPDCLEMLPALKVWCDWLMTHVDIWNPPPSCQDYKVGPAGDCWIRIAQLVNLLEKIDYKSDFLTTERHEDYELVYLPEDATLSGFTPLMANIHEPKYRHKDIDLELSQVSLRIHKIVFFGTVFLCGVDPPVLKLQKVETGDSEYISVVDTEHTQEQAVVDENETWSESEDSGKETGQEEDELEVIGLAARRRQLQQQAKSRLSQVVRITNALTEMEIRPHDLVPDTNCFIEFLSELEKILKVLPNPQHPYVLMVPLIVVNELEGLSKGCKPSQSVHHSALVRETAKSAMGLFQKRHPALKTCTSRGTVLFSTTFTLEQDSGIEMTNDDKILTTCMNLCRTSSKDEIKEGGKRKLYRDVVLLTEDRNLTLKAMARDMPVRSLPDFMSWAGLG